MNNKSSISTTVSQCTNCKLQTTCLPEGLPFKDFERLGQLVETHKKIPKGQTLFHYGEPFESLSVIRLGFMKSTITSKEGNEQVIGFHMSGDILGLDGLASGKHCCEITALEDTEVCTFPFKAFQEASQQIPKLQSHLLRMLGVEITKKHDGLLLLGSMHANERLAEFLLDLSERFEARGYSRSEFVLRMTRAEIGSYLGLKLETISRALSKFTDLNLIEINQKHVHILDPDGLKRLIIEGLPQK